MSISQTSILSEIEQGKPIPTRTRAYYRRRLQNRIHRLILSAFRERQKKTGLNQKQLAERIDKDRAEINRWLGIPSNLTLETISDLLLGLGVDLDDPSVTPIADLVHETDQQIDGEQATFNIVNATIEESKSFWPGGWKPSQLLAQPEPLGAGSATSPPLPMPATGTAFGAAETIQQQTQGRAKVYDFMPTLAEKKGSGQPQNALSRIGVGQ